MSTVKCTSRLVSVYSKMYLSRLVSVYSKMKSKIVCLLEYLCSLLGYRNRIYYFYYWVQPIQKGYLIVFRNRKSNTQLVIRTACKWVNCILPWHLLGHAVMSVICFDLQFSRSTRPMTSFCIFIAYINTDGILFNVKITRWD